MTDCLDPGGTERRSVGAFPGRGEWGSDGTTRESVGRTVALTFAALGTAFVDPGGHPFFEISKLVCCLIGSQVTGLDSGIDPLGRRSNLSTDERLQVDTIGVGHLGERLTVFERSPQLIDIDTEQRSRRRS